jgi:hypothetical protein
MFVAWVMFPLVLLAVCLGCGLLVERVGGWRLQGGLLPSLGLALVIVTATLTTSHEKTVFLTTPLVVLAAIAGYASSWRRFVSLRPSGWPLAVGLGVFACCAAPIVLSGNATFLGYFVLNDAATHFMLIDQFLTHAHDLSRLQLSSYYSTLHTYIASSYPLGADLALGAVRPLVGQDIAWIFQPYQAVIMALGGVAVYELLDGTVDSRPLRAGCAFIAAQSGLLFAYYLEASIKELATTWIITVTVALVIASLRQRLTLRGLVPLLVATAAGLDLLDLAIVPWLGPPLAVFAAATVWSMRRQLRGRQWRRFGLIAAGAIALLVVLVEPIIGTASTFVYVTTAVLTTPNDLGNLSGPLAKWQVMGIWPSGDFRVPPASHIHLTYVIVGVAIAGAVLGAAWTARRRAWGPLLLLVGNGIAALYLLHGASPYATAKVMVVFSLTAVLMAMLGVVALRAAGRVVEAVLLGLVIAGGVLWTNALAYHGASVAPRHRLAELATIGQRFKGQAPLFYNQVDEFAVPFLRDERPFDTGQFASATLRSGLPPRRPDQFREPYDPDDLEFSYVEFYRLLVLGRSPEISRPPANFRLAYRGRYYDVWQRTATPTVLAHIPLGNGLYPSAVPACHLVTALGRQAAREHAAIAYVPRPQPPTLIPTRAAHPPNWGLVADQPFDLIPRQQPGAVVGSVLVRQPGRYQVWLDASLSQRFQVYVGGRHVGSVAYELGPPDQFVPVGSVRLGPGLQTARIVRPPSNLSPGDDPLGQQLGPLMLVREPDPPPVSQIPPSQARSLCGSSLDWLEIVR